MISSPSLESTSKMKIMVASDHAGVELKERIAARLGNLGHEVEDIGTHGPESVDYPAYAATVARAVAQGKVDRGVLICGSGIGMCMVANRFEGVRAVQGADPFTAKMSRRHNNSNVLCMGARFIGTDMALEILETWLDEPFEAERHQKRVELIDRLTR
jgi:ribose 5-phosphate isomerase B